jgi:nucleotide-binding universal stress UspA family protein
MTDDPPPPSSILVDIELPDPAPLSPALLEALSPLRVVLLGWFAVPEQTSPAQAQDQFRDEAQATLDRVARRFEDAGGEVTTRLVFTGDQLDTITRVSTEEDCDAVLIPGKMETLGRVLVPLRGLATVHRIAPFLADLCRDTTATVTLLHVRDEDPADGSPRENVLDPAAARMREHGLDPSRLAPEVVTAGAPAATIVDRASDFDLVVLGETEPSVREILFGTVPERIVTTTDVPVIAVRHEDEDVDAAEHTLQADST